MKALLQHLSIEAAEALCREAQGRLYSITTINWAASQRGAPDAEQARQTARIVTLENLVRFLRDADGSEDIVSIEPIR